MTVRARVPLRATEALAARLRIGIGDVEAAIRLLRSGRSDLIERVIGGELKLAAALQLAKRGRS